MKAPIAVHVDTKGLVPWGEAVKGRVLSIARMAGSSAAKAMKAEGSRRIRERKAMKVAFVNDAISVSPDSGKLVWRVTAKWKGVPVAAFPHTQTARAGRDEATGQFSQARKVKGGRGGVYVTINVGKRVLIRGAFIAKMKSGHQGVFMRKGKRNLPIRQLYTTTVADAFKDAIPDVVKYGRGVYVATFNRLLKNAPTRYSDKYITAWE